MTVRLVKRKDMLASAEKQPQPPSKDQLAVTTQGWIEEFRKQKARSQQSVHDLIKR